MGTLATWIREYLDDEEVSLRPGDLEAEARLNTWRFGVSADVASSHEALVDAMTSVVAGLRARWVGSAVSGRFYAWYDAQAGNLCCSLTSQEALPFRGRIRVTDDLDEVIAAVLADPLPGFVPCADVVDVADEDETVHDPEVPVWVAAVT